MSARGGGLVAALLASALALGCDDTVQPFLEDENAIFSMYGYLDLRADTQWVRVMPVRQTLLLGPDPIDAVVTLEHLGSGRVVTLHDSLVTFVDPRLGGAAYAHNFWTTERLEPEASYRLRAARSDGASTTALIVMPPELEILFRANGTGRRHGVGLARLEVRGERLLFVETLYAMGREVGDPPDTVPAGPIVITDHTTYATDVPGTHGLTVNTDTLVRPGLLDALRQDIRVVTGPADWPFDSELPDLTITLPHTAPSNVENGLGFVGGVASWTIAYDSCDVLEPRAGGIESCTARFNGQSASVAGKVIREPCGDPHFLTPVRLTERFADGGVVVRTWKTGWQGEYVFEGLEAGSEFLVEVGGEAAVPVPPLAPGERYAVADISVPVGCP